MTSTEYRADKVLAAFQEENCEFVLSEALPHAISGHATAQWMISLLYQCGLGVPHDMAKAGESLVKATAQDISLQKLPSTGCAEQKAGTPPANVISDHRR